MRMGERSEHHHVDPHYLQAWLPGAPPEWVRVDLRVDVSMRLEHLTWSITVRDGDTDAMLACHVGPPIGREHLPIVEAAILSALRAVAEPLCDPFPAKGAEAP